MQNIMIGLQAFVNIGVSSGLFPTKGLTLPLLSYGGSSLVVSAVIVAMLLRIHKETVASVNLPPVKSPSKAQTKSAAKKKTKPLGEKQTYEASPNRQFSWLRRWNKEASQ